MKLIEAHVTISEIFITEVVLPHVFNALLVYNVSLYKILLIYNRTAFLVVVPSVFDSLLHFFNVLYCNSLLLRNLNCSPLIYFLAFGAKVCIYALCSSCSISFSTFPLKHKYYLDARWTYVTIILVSSYHLCKWASLKSRSQRGAKSPPRQCGCQLKHSL